MDMTPKQRSLQRTLGHVVLGASLTAAALFWLRLSDERTLTTQVVAVAERKAAAVFGPVLGDGQRAVAILQTVHEMTAARRKTFEGVSLASPHLLWDTRAHLNNPAGACGSCTHALAGVLSAGGFPVRKVGIEHRGEKAVHHVLEAWVGDRWVLMDGYYGVVFHRRDGSLASGEDVRGDWEFYSTQTPAGYPEKYDFSGLYYTNWSRIPGAETLFAVFPGLPVWLREQQISLRFIFLDINAWCLGLSLVCAGAVPCVRLAGCAGQWLSTAVRHARLLTGSLRLPKPAGALIVE